MLSGLNIYIIPLLVTILSVILSSIVLADDNKEESKKTQKNISICLIIITIISLFVGTGGIILNGRVVIIPP